jgi:hypothetical protein
VRSAEQSEKAEQGLGDAGAKREKLNAGWSSPVARQAHNLKVVGSNPTPATIASSAAWPESRVADLAHRKQPFLILLRTLSDQGAFCCAAKASKSSGAAKNPYRMSNSLQLACPIYAFV